MANLITLSNNSLKKLEIQDNTLIICVPGAFTPGCNKHLPEFANNMDIFNRNNVTVVFVATNDPLVMDAWNNNIGHSDIIVAGDENGAWTSQFVDLKTDFWGNRLPRVAFFYKDQQYKQLNSPWLYDVIKELGLQ